MCIRDSPETAEVLQRNLYYPFGLAMEGEWEDMTTPNMDYLYNGKELNTDFDLNWLDYGARYYDPAIARWNAVDPLADSYYSFSPYNYVLNNPIGLIDPNGMFAAPPNEYVKDKQTGDLVKISNKGGNETDYVYEGEVHRDANGDVNGWIFHPDDVTELDVEISYHSGPFKFQEDTPTPGERLYHGKLDTCLLYTSPSPRDATLSRMPSSA